MKKLLILFKPLALSILSLLIVTCFLRYYLTVNSAQLLKEFKNQNFRELYSMDTLKLSSRMNALSSVINWVCIEGSVNGKNFYRMERGRCTTGIFKQRQELILPQANNIHIIFTTRLPKEVEQLFILFLMLQSILILALVKSTRNAEEEKRQNEIKISKMARQMSHDIRSPLATFNTVVNELRTIPREDLDLLKKSIKRITEIADSLLENSKLGRVVHTPESRAQLQSQNIAELIKDLVNEKKMEFKNNPGIILSFTSLESNLAVKIDPIELSRILSNLINNSVEAMINNSINIEVILEKKASNAYLRIIDNGRGITPEIIAKLGKSAITTKKHGNGLGLQHCFEKIREWGGLLNISSSVGEATTIEIILPQEIVSIKKAVLIDDDELVKLTWASAARRHNVELMTISTQQELLELMSKLSKETPFYIDSDLGNGIRGEDLATELYANGYQNLFMASGYTDEQFSHMQFLKGVINKSPPWK